MKRFLGLDIGGTKCAVVIGDAEGRVERDFTPSRDPRAQAKINARKQKIYKIVDKPIIL